MGITYGDHLIDSGYYDITPEQEREIEERKETEMTDLYLVWSNQHHAWWRPNSCGYTKQISDAGRYSRAEAIEISRGRGWPTKGVPDEVPVSERDAVECFAVSGAKGNGND